MTRASGYQPFECPHCGLGYRITSYSSMNFMDFKRWSDGRFEGRLVADLSPLLTCSCGEVFLSSKVKFGDFMRDSRASDNPRPITPLPSPWKAIHTGVAKLFGAIEEPNQETPTTEAVPELAPPYAMRVDDQDLSKLIGKKAWDDDIELELAIYQRLWQHLNRPYCDQLVTMGREAIAKDSSPPVVPFFYQDLYQTTSEQVTTMTHLLDLFTTAQPDDWLVIMELQRELGLLEEAKETFIHRLTGSHEHDEKDGAMLYSMVQQGVTAPALIAYG